MNKPVLVTGGAGFIGSHASKQLAAAGFAPVAYDNLSTGHDDSVQWGPLIVGDVRDTARLTESLRQHGVGTVMHFAASAYVGESVSDPALYYDNNVCGMASLLTACRDAGVNEIVFSSSCATYGLPDTLPIREQSPQHPINPYGRTKLICEQMLEDHAHAYGLRYVALRYFNACGADPDGTLTERHDPETHLIPIALMAAAGTRTALGVFGDDYDTPDGTCIRDYIHVTDLAEGHVAALRYLRDGGDNLKVNLGTGTGRSIMEIIRAIEDLTGTPLPVEIKPRRAGDPPVLYADNSLARRVLGFAPRRSEIAQIIRDAAPSFGVRLAHDD
ncbi:MAG: UDP-glucose 4-epimerase GalE [Rhodobacterales bacterium]|nr:MAG: UDP-glucose 4-epimerase GalE [Rhodobacterales bacterium]